MKKTSKPIKKNIKNEATKKRAKKALQTSIWRAILASKTSQKSIKKLSKNDVEKDNRKSGLRTLPKKPVLVRNGKREDI